LQCTVDGVRPLWLPLACACVGSSLVSWHHDAAGRGGTVTYRGKNLRPDILAERRQGAVDEAARACRGPIAVTGERLEGFNEHFVDFECVPDGGQP
jgi:hypothetical protein